MYAIGSGYLIRQAAGAERVGGVTVELRPRSDSGGNVEVILTDWLTDQAIDDDISWLVEAALVGIRRFSDEHSINLSDWDITVSKFAYHPSDSGSLTTQIAGYNAIASAWASWNQVRLKKHPDAG